VQSFGLTTHHEVILCVAELKILKGAENKQLNWKRDGSFCEGTGGCEATEPNRCPTDCSGMLTTKLDCAFLHCFLAVANDAKEFFKWNCPLISRESLKMHSKLFSDLWESFETLPHFRGEFETQAKTCHSSFLLNELSPKTLP